MGWGLHIFIGEGVAMTTKGRACVALCIVVFTLNFAGLALGQLTPVGSPVLGISPGPTTVSQPTGGEFQLSIVDDVYTLTGDLHAQLPETSTVPSFSVYVSGTQRVSVGPLPV